MRAVRSSRRRLLTAAAVAPFAFALAPPARAQAKGKLDIFIGTTPHFGNIIVADRRGFFAKEGLQATVTNFASGSVAADAFRAGKGDIVVTGDLPALRLWSQGFVGITPQANYDQLSVIVAKNSIKSGADMKGRKVGVLLGSTSEFFNKLYLQKAGLTPKDVEVVNLRPAEMVTGLARGDIDAFVIWQPFGWRALAAVKDAHLLASAKGYFHEWQAATTRRDLLGARDGELMAFVKGIDAAGKWIAANLDEAAKVVAEGIRLDDPKLARDMLAVIDGNLAYTPKFRKDMDLVASFIDLKPDWAKWFDARILERVSKGYVS